MLIKSTPIRNIALSLILLAGGAGSIGVMGQVSHQVAVTNNVFTPNELTVISGDTVIWTNNTGMMHNVNGTTMTFPDNPASFGNLLGSNWSYSFVFKIPGIYYYQCDPHASSGMTGMITVLQDPNNISLTIAFSEMAPHIGQTLWLSLIDAATREEATRLQMETREFFNLKISGLKEGHSYQADVFVDHNMNGRYDNPPVDHAWRVYIDQLSEDTLINFDDKAEFTDIAWKYKLTVDYIGMFPHVGQAFTFFVRESSGNYIDTIQLTVPAANFQVNSYKIVPDSSYMLDFFADHNGNGGYDPPPADHAWRMMLNGVTGDTTLTFTHNIIFTDIFKAGSSSVFSEQTEQGIQVYPNPAANILNILVKGAGSEALSVRIFNMMGAMVLSEEYPAGRDQLGIDIRDFPRGLYVLNVRSGAENHSYRFIAQ